jgi:hypothetical protein
MAWSIGTLQGLRRINTVQDLTRVAPVPVVGQLAIDPVNQNLVRYQRRGHILRWICLACELTLGSLIVVFLVAALEGSPTVAQMADDPLGSMADTILRALHRWF